MERRVGKKTGSKRPPGAKGRSIEMNAASPLLSGFVRGALPSYLLSLLLPGPLHGSQMMQSMEEMSGGTWRPSPGSVYPILQRLEKQGLILGKLERGRAAPRRVYRLTAKGRSAIPKMQRQLLQDLKAARTAIDIHIEALEQDATGGVHGHQA